MSNMGHNYNHAMQSDLLKAMNGKIKQLAAAEKITKKVFGELSIDLLRYYSEYMSNDIAALNRTINVLSPANRRVGVMFFSAFLPWKYDAEKEIFTTKQGDKAVNAKFEACREFLAAGLTIWDWQEDNVDMEIKPANWSGKISTLITKAMSDTRKVGDNEVDNDEKMEAVDILKAVMVGGVTFPDIIRLVEELTSHAAEADQRKADSQPEPEPAPVEVVEQEEHTEPAKPKKSRSKKAA